MHLLIKDWVYQLQVALHVMSAPENPAKRDGVCRNGSIPSEASCFVPCLRSWKTVKVFKFNKTAKDFQTLKALTLALVAETGPDSTLVGWNKESSSWSQARVQLAERVSFLFISINLFQDFYYAYSFFAECWSSFQKDFRLTDKLFHLWGNIDPKCLPAPMAPSSSRKAWVLRRWGDLAFDMHGDSFLPWRQALASTPCNSVGHWVGFTQGFLKYMTARNREGHVVKARQT